MLTKDEVAEVAADILTRVQDARSLEEPERTNRITSHLGIQARFLNGIGDAIIELEFGLDPDAVRFFSPPTAAATQIALAVGIEIGKKIEKMSHVEEA